MPVGTRLGSPVLTCSCRCRRSFNEDFDEVRHRRLVGRSVNRDDAEVDQLVERILFDRSVEGFGFAGLIIITTVNCQFTTLRSQLSIYNSKLSYVDCLTYFKAQNSHLWERIILKNHPTYDFIKDFK